MKYANDNISKRVFKFYIKYEHLSEKVLKISEKCVYLRLALTHVCFVLFDLNPKMEVSLMGTWT